MKQQRLQQLLTLNSLKVPRRVHQRIYYSIPKQGNQHNQADNLKNLKAGVWVQINPSSLPSGFLAFTNEPNSTSETKLTSHSWLSINTLLILHGTKYLLHEGIYNILSVLKYYGEEVGKKKKQNEANTSISNMYWVNASHWKKCTWTLKAYKEKSLKELI